MSAARTTVSMPASLYREAMERKKELRYPKFSEYVRVLIEADVTLRPNHVRAPSLPAHPAHPPVAASASSEGTLRKFVERVGKEAAKRHHSVRPQK